MAPSGAAGEPGGIGCAAAQRLEHGRGLVDQLGGVGGVGGIDPLAALSPDLVDERGEHVTAVEVVGVEASLRAV